MLTKSFSPLVSEGLRDFIARVRRLRFVLCCWNARACW